MSVHQLSRRAEAVQRRIMYAIPFGTEPGSATRICTRNSEQVKRHAHYCSESYFEHYHSPDPLSRSHWLVHHVLCRKRRCTVIFSSMQEELVRLHFWSFFKCNFLVTVPNTMLNFVIHSTPFVQPRRPLYSPFCNSHNFSRNQFRFTIGIYAPFIVIISTETAIVTAVGLTTVYLQYLFRISCGSSAWLN